jgi:hypothetical protein
MMIIDRKHFRCVECQLTNAFKSTELYDIFDKFRLLKFIEMTTTQTSINALKNNGTYQKLKFGEDTFFELNFYEDNIKDNGWVKTMWRVWVKPHL